MASVRDTTAATFGLLAQIQSKSLPRNLQQGVDLLDRVATGADPLGARRRTQWKKWSTSQWGTLASWLKKSCPHTARVLQNFETLLEDFSPLLEVPFLIFSIFAIGKSAMSAAGRAVESDLGPILDCRKPDWAMAKRANTRDPLNPLYQPGQEQHWKTFALREGFAPELHDLLDIASKTWLSVGELVEARNRGLLTDAELGTRISTLGYSEEDATLVVVAASRHLSGGEILQLLSRAQISDADAQRRLEQFGYSREDAASLIAIDKRFLSVGEALDLWRRGEIGEKDIDRMLAEQDVDPADLPRVKALGFTPIGLRDATTLAHFAAAGPAVVTTWGLDGPHPDWWSEDARAAGMADDVADDVWRAHWQLPGQGAILSLLHRGALTREQAKARLLALGYCDGGAEEVIGASYSPLSIRQIGGMYTDGMVPPAELPARFRAMGYAPPDADLLSQWFIKTKTWENKRMGQGDLEAGYRDGILSAEQLTNAYQDMGYAREVALTMVHLQDHTIARAHENALVENIRVRYVKKLIDRTQAQNELYQAGVPAEEAQTYLLKWKQEKKSAMSTTIPSPSDFKDFYTRGLIDETAYRAGLSMHGFRDADIDLYVAAVNTPKPNPVGDAE